MTLPSLMTVYQYDSLGRLDTLSDYQLTTTSQELTASYDYEVRPDGKRTGVDETFWIDADDDGVQDTGELETTSTTWTYDSMGRLTDEVIDHWDDSFDQTESYQYDLTGNRIALERTPTTDGSPLPGQGEGPGVRVEYRYDANDRLFAELADDRSIADDDTTTVYQYDHTQQTAKTVYTSLLDETTLDALVAGGDDSAQQRVSSQTFTYNLQGRMNQAVVDAYDSGGNLQTRTRSTYEYDRRSFRVGQTIENWNDSTSSFDLASSISYLVSHSNHTGYAQTLRETTTNADGSTKTIDYTFGNDEIAQRVVERDDQGTITSDVTQVFGHDGHGSIRILYDLAATGHSIIEAIATYSAYGVLIATHSGMGVVHASAFDQLSTLTYSGEAWDSVLNRGYNRARWYDASSAQWNRLDPFAGNMQDPQSLHKYAYVHGDPINATDPTGLMSLSSNMSANSIVGSMMAIARPVASFLLRNPIKGGALLGGASSFIDSTLDPRMSWSEVFVNTASGAAMGAFLGRLVGPAGSILNRMPTPWRNFVISQVVTLGASLGIASGGYSIGEGRYAQGGFRIGTSLLGIPGLRAMLGRLAKFPTGTKWIFPEKHAQWSQHIAAKVDEIVAAGRSKTLVIGAPAPKGGSRGGQGAIVRFIKGDGQATAEGWSEFALDFKRGLSDIDVRVPRGEQVSAEVDAMTYEFNRLLIRELHGRGFQFKAIGVTDPYNVSDAGWLKNSRYFRMELEELQELGTTPALIDQTRFEAAFD